MFFYIRNISKIHIPLAVFNAPVICTIFMIIQGAFLFFFCLSITDQSNVTFLLDISFCVPQKTYCYGRTWGCYSFKTHSPQWSGERFVLLLCFDTPAGAPPDPFPSVNAPGKTLRSGAEPHHLCQNTFPMRQRETVLVLLF